MADGRENTDRVRNIKLGKTTKPPISFASALLVNHVAPLGVSYFLLPALLECQCGLAKKSCYAHCKLALPRHYPDRARFGE